MGDLKKRLPNGDPLIDLADVCDANEVLLRRAENERRARDRAEQKANFPNCLLYTSDAADE